MGELLREAIYGAAVEQLRREAEWKLLQEAMGAFDRRLVALPTDFPFAAEPQEPQVTH